MTLTRFSQGTEGRNLTTDEQKKISLVLGNFSGPGTIANESVSFENSDERSQETISELIKNKMIS